MLSKPFFCRFTGFLLMLLFLLAACQKKPESGPLCGAWKMVEGKYESPDFSVQTSKENRLCYKVISSDHFAVVELYLDSPDSVLFTAVGSYTLSDSVYVEQYEATNMPYKVGTSMRFNSRLEGDRWILEAQEKGMKLYEVWERLQ